MEEEVAIQFQRMTHDQAAMTNQRAMTDAQVVGHSGLVID